MQGNVHHQEENFCSEITFALSLCQLSMYNNITMAVLLYFDITENVNVNLGLSFIAWAVVLVRTIARLFCFT